MTSQPRPYDQCDLLQVRRRFGLLLTTHLKRALWAIYPQMLASEDRDVADAARRGMYATGLLDRHHKEHTSRWTATTITLAWPHYVREAEQLIDAVLQRLEQERAEIAVVSRRHAPTLTLPGPASSVQLAA
jgi:hypothetical protein